MYVNIILAAELESTMFIIFDSAKAFHGQYRNKDLTRDQYFWINIFYWNRLCAFSIGS